MVLGGNEVVVPKRILIVSPDFPFPPNHGARLDIWGRIRFLYELGFTVDLIATVKTMPPDEDIQVVKTYVDRVIICKRAMRILEGFLLPPMQILSRNNLLHIKLKDKYDFVILETQHVFPILNNSTLSTSFVVLRMHNNEFEYFKQLAKSVKIGIEKIYYFIESYKFLLFDKEIIKRIDNYMFISNEEYADFKKKNPHKNSIFLPAPVEGEFKSRKLEKRNVLFVGSLFMHNNREAISWYINHVHTQLTDIDNYRLINAGKTRGQTLEWLLKLTRTYNNIIFYDSPPDLEAIYDKCSVFVNPMLHGAGVKLKTIEAIKNGLPVVSTTIGNQGTGLSHMKEIYVSDDPKQFSEFIRKLLLASDERDRLVFSAQEFLHDFYNHKEILSDYLAALQNKFQES